jgi:hypothetical protein
MIPKLPRSLRLVFSRRPPTPSDQPQATPAPPALIDLAAYATDCRLFGRIGLSADRLTDVLNNHDEFVLVDAWLESLGDGHVVDTPEVVVSRDEIHAVHAGGPRGDPRRRTRTRPFPIAVQTGPYTMRGYLHALPGSDPIASLRRRRPMVPLTEAWIEYQSGGIWQRGRVGTMVVNRDLADWFEPISDEDIDLPEIPDLPLPVPQGPLVKDFTGQLMTFNE